MRMRSERTRQMITVPEVPRTAWGGIALCHICQRSAYFAGGFLLLLVEDLKKAARFPHSDSAQNLARRITSLLSSPLGKGEA